MGELECFVRREGGNKYEWIIIRKPKHDGRETKKRGWLGEEPSQYRTQNLINTAL